MISTRVRLAMGLAALIVAAAACYVLLRTHRPIGAALFAPAAMLALPLFASNRPPRAEEWDALNENVARFRMAGMVCFTIAVLINVGHPSDSVAALGVAWWAVGFALLPFALYFASRRAMLEEDDAE
jgi:hypothetical protein